MRGWAGSVWCRIQLGSNSFIIIIFSISLNEIISFHNFYRLGYIRLDYISRGVSTDPASFYYPISTLPEHLHSTIPSYAKIPENTLTEKKNSFSLFNAHYLFDRSPQLPHPLHWETQPHPLIHNHSILSAQGERSRLLESHPMFRLLRLSLSYRCFLFINFY